DWLRQRPAPRSAAAPEKTATATPTAAPAVAKPKRSFKEQRELEQLPKQIERLETDIAAHGEAMNEPAFFKQDSAAITRANEAVAALQAELDAAYARWTALDG
ncbi:MAG: ABC transporter ATP-binding protein, partial [Pseudomonadota bacterium]|nr:ABC transporter ATP-binding protein [Pseudomonadota bacterium]